LEARQRGERQALQAAYDAETQRVQGQRGGRKTIGLVAILARVSGFNVLRRQFEKHHDKRRHARFLEELGALDEPQARARLDLQRRHEAQSFDMDRQLRALAQVEGRELKSLETELVKEQRVKTRARGGGNRMPALNFDLNPPAAAMPPGGGENLARVTEKDLLDAGGLHTRRRGGRRGGSGGATSGSSDGNKPTDPTKPDGPKHKRRRDRDRDIDLDR
jgi:hypothetical protein